MFVRKLRLSARFDTQTVHVETFQQDSLPPAVSLLGPSDSVCLNIAQRLAKKTGKQVFVSGELTHNQLMLPLIEKRISEEMKNYPEKFYEAPG